MDGLPKDVAFLLLQWFGTADVERLGATCRAWRAMAERFWNEAARRAELHCSLVVLSRTFKFHKVEELYLHLQDNTTSELVTVFSLRNCRKLCVFGSAYHTELSMLITHCPRLEWLELDQCEMISSAIYSSFKTERELVRGIKVILGRKADSLVFRGIENRAALEIAIGWLMVQERVSIVNRRAFGEGREIALAFLRFRRGDPDWKCSFSPSTKQTKVDNAVEAIEASTHQCTKVKDLVVTFFCEDCMKLLCAFCGIHCHGTQLNHITMMVPYLLRDKPACSCIKC